MTGVLAQKNRYGHCDPKRALVSRLDSIIAHASPQYVLFGCGDARMGYKLFKGVAAVGGCIIGTVLTSRAPKK